MPSSTGDDRRTISSATPMPTRAKGALERHARHVDQVVRREQCRHRRRERRDHPVAALHERHDSTNHRINIDTPSTSGVAVGYPTPSEWRIANGIPAMFEPYDWPKKPGSWTRRCVHSEAAYQSVARQVPRSAARRSTPPDRTRRSTPARPRPGESIADRRPSLPPVDLRTSATTHGPLRSGGDRGPRRARAGSTTANAITATRTVHRIHAGRACRPITNAPTPAICCS